MNSKLTKTPLFNLESKFDEGEWFKYSPSIFSEEIDLSKTDEVISRPGDYITIFVLFIHQSMLLEVELVIEELEDDVLLNNLSTKINTKRVVIYLFIIT